MHLDKLAGCYHPRLRRADEAVIKRMEPYTRTEKKKEQIAQFKDG